nr:uncharacterized protein LOC110086739 [Pogona vitticeps]
MGKSKRTLSQTSPDLAQISPSSKQLRLDSFFPPQPSTSTTTPLKRSASSTNKTQEVHTPSTTHPPEQRYSKPLPSVNSRLDCDAIELIKHYSTLTARTVSQIFSQLTLLTDFLKSSCSISPHCLSCLHKTPDKLNSAVCKETPPSSFSDGCLPQVPSKPIMHLVYVPHAAVVTIGPPRGFTSFPRWTKIALAKRHLAFLLKVNVRNIDLYRTETLSTSFHSTRLLLTFHSNYVPGMLFSSANLLQRWGVTPHRLFKNTTIARLISTEASLQPPPTDASPSSKRTKLFRTFRPTYPPTDSLLLSSTSISVYKSSQGSKKVRLQHFFAPDKSTVMSLAYKARHLFAGLVNGNIAIYTKLEGKMTTEEFIITLMLKKKKSKY